MENSIRYIDEFRACEVIDQYIPMIKELNDNNIDYCVVGGLAVLLHAIQAGIDQYRLTHDADIMVGNDYPNDQFAKAYLSVYANDPDMAEAIYNAMFEKGDIEKLSLSDNREENISFIGANLELDGVETPNFDIARKLNKRDVDTITTVTIEYGGTAIKVADIDTLKAMKQETIELLRMPIEETPRPQDYHDIRILGLVEKATKQNKTTTG